MKVELIYQDEGDTKYFEMSRAESYYTKPN